MGRVSGLQKPAPSIPKILVWGTRGVGSHSGKEGRLNKLKVAIDKFCCPEDMLCDTDVRVALVGLHEISSNCSKFTALES